MWATDAGPPPQRGQAEPSAASLKRLGAYVKPVRVLSDKPVLSLTVPGPWFPKWCFCLVRGRLVKRVRLPNGSIAERPVCNGRVHVCEVDRIPVVISKLPDADVFRLRDDLVAKLRVPPLPVPGPDPEPATPAFAALSQRLQVFALASAHSVAHLRSSLVGLSSLITLYLCDLSYLWGTSASTA